MLVKIRAAHIEDHVAVDHVAAVINRQAAVGVAVVGKAHVEPLLKHMTTQALHVRGTAINVDVEAIRRVGDHADVGAKGVEHGLCHRGGGAVGAVQADLYALQGEIRAGDQVRNIAVAALHIIDRAANLIARGERDLALAVDVVLDELKDFLVHLAAFAVHELDAVVGVGGCGSPRS